MPTRQADWQQHKRATDPDWRRRDAERKREAYRLRRIVETGQEPRPRKRKVL